MALISHLFAQLAPVIVVVAGFLLLLLIAYIISRREP